MERHGGATFRPPSHMARAAVRRSWESEEDRYPGSSQARRGGRAEQEEDHDEEAHEEEEEEEHQFVLSVANTPAAETAPKLTTATRRMMVAEPRSSMESTQSFDELSDASLEDTSHQPASSTIERSQPIAIEMPNGRTAKSGPPSNTTAPLSARGDLPGGYFPRHEDPDTRVLRPHPFHGDAKEARRQSLARASEQCACACPSSNAAGSMGQPHHTHPSTSAPAMPAAASSSSSSQKRNPATAAPAASSSTVPNSVGNLVGSYSHSYSSDQGNVMSYNPTGALDGHLPMGKYYPTNWENRKKQKRLAREQQAQLHSQSPGHQRKSDKGKQESTQAATQPPTKPAPFPAGVVSSSSSSSQAANLAPPAAADHPSLARIKVPALGHSRSDSEAKRQLQQYQRDMITQAALAASQALGGAIQQRGSDSVMQTLNRIPTLRNLHLSSPPTPPSSSCSAGGGARSPPAPPSLSAMHSSLRGGFLPRPVSPRLQPLGSPGGPMTPMELASDPAGAVGHMAGPDGRPKLPLGVVSAPPGGQHLQSQRHQHHQEATAFPFLIDRA